MKWVMRAAIANALWMTGSMVAWPWAATAQVAPQRLVFALSAADLNAALRQWAAQTHIQLIYPSTLTDGKRTTGVSGSYLPAEALDRLLAGTGLVAERVNERTLVLKQGGRQSNPSSDHAPTSKATPASSTSAANAGPTDLTAVTVTGTRIRGGVSASPTITIDQQQFKQEGFTDLGQVMRSVSQNYGGGQNPGVGTGASIGDQTNHNLTGGSAVNLRGLGPGATLTLLNGQRLSYDGVYQAVDISAIPIEAVDRIEIVPDGASAIYGSDAVGGVVNVILKPDFDGVTVGSVYGDSADGGGIRREYTGTAGTTWASGGFIATFKKADQDPIYANQRSYTDALQDPTTIYPGSTLRSGLVSFHQALGDAVELRVDALHTVRTTTLDAGYAGFSYLTREDSTVNEIAPSLQIALPNDWMMTTGLSKGKDDAIAQTFYQSGGIFSLKTGVCQCNDSRSWDLGAEGPLAQLGAQREVRLAVGVGERNDDFQYRYLTSNPRYGGSEQDRYAYSELSLPVVGADNALPGLHRLEFTAAVRTDDYDGFGSDTTPKLGVLYDPSQDFTFKASWGRSFKAPTLYQRFSGRYAYLYPAQQAGCSSCASEDTVLETYGGNPDLKAERARTWTTSLNFHPDALPDFNAELTYFHIDYTQRVVAPLAVTAQILSNPAYAQFVTYNPSAASLQQLLTEYNGGFYNYTGSSYDASQVIAVAADQNVNVARQRADGLDLTGSYRMDFGAGKLEWRGSVSRLHLDQQNEAGQPDVELSGMIYYPAKLNTRAGAVWTRNGFSLSAFANYVSGVTSTLTSAKQKTASFTTFDTTAGYTTSPGTSLLSDVTLALSASNLLNRRPPVYTPPYANYLPYDSTNYSAIGRYVTVSVNKHW